MEKVELLHIYKNLLYPRLIEEKMLNFLRQGKIGKWFSGIGQEAISVGCTLALEEDEKIFSMHRNLGVFTSRGISLKRLYAQWKGMTEGFTKGRDRSFHFGAPDHHIVGMISHLGPQLSLSAGVALAHKLRNEHKVSLAFTGEGGTSQGEFHEALNVASVWKLPVIFVIENNAYGLSTPTSEQYACEKLVHRAKGYGMKSKEINGNNVLEVYQTIQKIAKKIRKNPEPYLIECHTFRMRGHEEASGQKYVPKELIEQWAQRDPIATYEQYLLSSGVLTEKYKEELYAALKEKIQAELAEVETYTLPESTPALELADVYSPVELYQEKTESATTEMRFIDAISDGLSYAMDTYDDLVLMGQDIADYGGVFKITEGFVEKYGKGRVRNTPLCESAIIGIGMGLSIAGMKAMVEMQFADFVTCGFNQIVNNLAKVHYRWGQQADVVIRMPTGGSVGAGPYHSQSIEAWFYHVPGLKIVYPSTPADAKGLLISALEDPNPVMYFEHKALYRTVTGDVPESDYRVPIGKARVARSGSEATIITYGLGVNWAENLIEEKGWDIEVIDLRSLSPIDWETIEISVEKTGRVLVLHEATLTGGIGGDISAYISENLFHHLDAPVYRVASLDTPVPFQKDLENIFLASARLEGKVVEMLGY